MAIPPRAILFAHSHLQECLEVQSYDLCWKWHPASHCKFNDIPKRARSLVNDLAVGG